MISAEQREARRKFLGSSDAAAAFGVDPYRSPADVWLDKTGRTEDFEGNEATDRGALLEPAVLAWAESALAASFSRDMMKVHPNGLLAANFDGIQWGVHTGGGEGPGPGAINDEPFIVEAKTTVNGEDWGEEGTNEVPDRVMVQVHHQMVVAGPAFRVAYVPVLMPGYRSFEFRLYRVPRYDKLAAAVESRGVEFMERFVRADKPPTDYHPNLEVLQRVKRVPKSIVPVPDVAVQLWKAATAREKKAKEECDRAKADLIACMTDVATGEGAEAGKFSAGMVTYYQQTRKAHTVAESSFRVLRLKED